MDGCIGAALGRQVAIPQARDRRYNAKGEVFVATRKKNGKLERREFLKKVAAGGALAGGVQAFAQDGPHATARKAATPQRPSSQLPSLAKEGQGMVRSRIAFPRTFSGPNLKMIAFPLGGIGTGTISLGGRGQLRDWEIFNRPDKGNTPDYCFPAIWAQAEGKNPVARVLEARIQPPYEGPSGLGSENVPGLPRLASACFVGAYPFARLEFEDKALPILVSLEAFNPLVPLDAEASGTAHCCAALQTEEPCQNGSEGGHRLQP